MNMFARFDENPAMTLQDIKETKRYGQTHRRTDGRTDGRTDAHMDGQRENSIPTTNKVCGGIKLFCFINSWRRHMQNIVNQCCVAGGGQCL